VSDQERIIVLGIGNPLVRDEGVGIRIIEELMSSYEFPDNVQLIDAGTMGLSILSLFRDCDYMLIVDAVDGTGHEPGTVVRVSPEDIAPNQVKHSLHDNRFIDVLEAAELVGTRPAADCIGVQVKELVSVVIGLTPEVEAAVPVAVEAALQVLAEHGVVAQPRTDVSEDGRLLEAMRIGEPTIPSE
jgi:hydrogenase maturation protease